MDSSHTLPLHTTEKKDQRQSQFSMKYCLIAVLLILGLAVIIAACTAVVVLYPQLKRGSAPSSHMDLKSKEKIHSMLVQGNQGTAVAKRFVNPRRRQGITCSSLITNDTIPVAHINGRRIKWGTTEPPTGFFNIEGQGYRTNWVCNDTYSNMKAFVKGGMRFDDQRLYFPTCGYYYISSQILFQYYPEDNQDGGAKSAVHSIEVTPNCTPNGYDDSYHLYSHSSLIEERYMKTSTYIGDIAKICEGGSIKIVIPIHRNLCCANGDQATTHFSAFLVSEADDCS